MKKGITFVGLMVIALLILLWGCQSAPQKELTAAKDALQKAQEAEADKYASDLYTQAQNSISEAENLIASKKYGDAKQLLINAQQVAESAAQQAASNKDETKTEVEDYFAAIEGDRKQLAETQNLSKQWKLPESTWKLTDETAQWDQGVQRARTEYNAGNYYEAKQLAAQIHQEVTEKDNELRSMIMEKQKK
jgi:hypothetical protein